MISIASPLSPRARMGGACGEANETRLWLPLALTQMWTVLHRYAGTGTTIIELPTCQNGIKDGSESDVDCGGLCKQKCGPQKKCAKAGDCFKNMCLKNTCGGKSGSSQSEVGAAQRALCTSPRSITAAVRVHGEFVCFAARMPQCMQVHTHTL